MSEQEHGPTERCGAAVREIKERTLHGPVSELPLQPFSSFSQRMRWQQGLRIKPQKHFLKKAKNLLRWAKAPETDAEWRRKEIQTV